MLTLKNCRHENFALALAKGKTADAAYAAAGFKAHRGNASRLSANESIRARVAELQGQVAERVVKAVAKTKTDVIRQLDEDRALAHKVDQAGAAVSASMAQARVLGLITDKHMVGMKRLEDMNEVELEALLDGGTDDARNGGKPKG